MANVNTAFVSFSNVFQIKITLPTNVLTGTKWLFHMTLTFFYLTEKYMAGRSRAIFIHGVKFMQFAFSFPWFSNSCSR